MKRIRHVIFFVLEDRDVTDNRSPPPKYPCLPNRSSQPTRASPSLDLPAGALPASHPNYSHDVNTDPPEIEPVEHRLRVDFIDGGPLTPHPLHGSHQPRPRRYADRTLTDIYQAEQRYYPSLPDGEEFADAPAFLRNELAPYFAELQDI